MSDYEDIVLQCFAREVHCAESHADQGLNRTTQQNKLPSRLKIYANPHNRLAKYAVEFNKFQT